MDRPPPNEFLYTLFTRSSNLLANCGNPGNLLILAPISSSLNLLDGETGSVFGDNMTDDFLQSHILRIAHRPDEQLERSKAKIYSTVNGKTMVIKDDAIFPHRGFRGVKEVRLLHDTLVWLDDPNTSPYLVYFLDKPLIGAPISITSMVKSSSVIGRTAIRDWGDLVRFNKSIGSSMAPVFGNLFSEFNEAVQNEDLGGDSPSRLNGSVVSRHDSSMRSRHLSSSSISPAPLFRTNTSQSFSTSSALQTLRVRVDLVITSAINAFQMLPTALLHTIGQDAGLTGPDVEKLIETHVLKELYDIIYFKIIGITQTRDEEIAAAIERSKHVDISQLGATSSLNLRYRHSLAIARFRGLGESHEPLAKLEALMATISVLMSQSEKSSDDLIPLLVSVVLKAGVSNLCANILWIREFAFTDVDTGEYGFAISTLEAVLYHISSSVKSLARSSLRNQQFLEAVREGQIGLVTSMAQETPELLEIRDLQDLTPQQLAPPAILTYLLSQTVSVSNMSHLLLANISKEVFSEVAALILSLDARDSSILLNQTDEMGQSLAHKIHEHPELLDQVYHLLDWRLKDKQGNTPLQVLARIYDHPEYEDLLDRVLKRMTFRSALDEDAGTSETVDGEYFGSTAFKVPLSDHVDAKGNTLLHVVSTYATSASVLRHCIGNFNHLNDKGLTPLLIAIKFARNQILKLLLQQSAIDPGARDSRGHSAVHYAARGSLAVFDICVQYDLNLNDRAVGSGVTALHIAAREGNIAVLNRLIELGVEEAWDWRGFRAGDVVKNDQVRSIMDEWSCRGREVRVLRGHVGDDCQVKYLIKSKSGGGVLRSVQDFLKLRQWMVTRYPSLGIATLRFDIPGPCQLHSRPARSVLMAVMERLDAFVQSLLFEPLINQNPLVWEFLLSPTLNEKQIIKTIQTELTAERDRIWQDEKAISNYESTDIFFTHARDQIITLSSTYRIFERKSRSLRDGQLNISVAYGLVAKAMDPVVSSSTEDIFTSALEGMSDCLVPQEPTRLYHLIEDIVSLNAKISGLLNSLSIPITTIRDMKDHQEQITRLERDLAQKPRLQLNLSLLSDSQSRKREATKERLAALHLHLDREARELRAGETQLADNLSRFYDVHARNALSVLRRFAARQVDVERARLRGMTRVVETLRRP